MSVPAADVAVPVVIVGAGPTGVTAAALLAGHGIRTVVLDRREDVHAQPRAVHLDDEVCRVLERAGVAEEFGRISRPALGLRLVDRDLRVLAEFRRDDPTGRHGFPQANMFDQPDLERLLRTAVTGRPEVELRGGADVTAVRQDARGVEVLYRDLATGRDVRLRAGYLLGCDGANSLVRRLIRSRMRTLGLAQRWLVVDVESERELGHWDGVHQVCDPDRAATFMRVGATRYRWEFRLLPGETASSFATLAALRPLLDPWLRDAGADGLTLVRSAEYTFRAQVARRWRDRRILLLGDAAHLTPPFIGQGLCAGLRDADNLAWKLSGVLRGRMDDSVLDSYQKERKPHATAMIRLAVLMGLAMTGGGRIADLARRAVLPRVQLVPGVRGRVVESATPPLHRSALVRRRALRFALAGTLCPALPRPAGAGPAAGSFLVVTRVPVGAAVEALVARREAVLLTAPPGSALEAWLRRGRATVALVRPDGAVLTAGRDPAEVCAALP